MRLSAQEEYGLRCLLQVAKSATAGPIAINEIATREGISPEYAAKLMRALRRAGLVISTRGAAGGYHLARDPREFVFQREADAVRSGLARLHEEVERAVAFRERAERGAHPVEVSDDLRRALSELGYTEQ